MKICVISSNVIPCPPTMLNPATGKVESCYAGLEMLTYQQACGLAGKGHQVALIAPKGSIVPSNVELIETELGEQEKQSYSKYWHRLLGFDAIMDSSWQKWSVILKAEGRLKAPSLLWCHCPVHTMFSSPPPIPKPCLVAISQDMATHIQEHLKCDSRVCYNGVDLNNYKFLNQPRNNRYLFLARFSSIKSPDIAVDIANKCRVPLDMVGDDLITAEPQLAQTIRDQCAISPYLRYVGPQSRSECSLWFNRNKALLHPINRYREPFGLTIIEGQLCGMPVIAWKNGSMPELIEHGKTGFVCNNQEEMEDVIRQNAVDSIDRSYCRVWASKWSVEAMVQRCEELVIEAINNPW